jgi:hypothetical protein
VCGSRVVRRGHGEREMQLIDPKGKWQRQSQWIPPASTNRSLLRGAVTEHLSKMRVGSVRSILPSVTMVSRSKSTIAFLKLGSCSFSPRMYAWPMF